MNFLKVFKFDFMNIIRNPMLLSINTIFPLVLLGAFGLVSSGNFSGDISSYDYYAVTCMVLSGMLVSMTVTNTFMEEKVKRGNFRLAYFPVSKTTMYLSKLLSTFIFASISYSLIILAVQYVFGCFLGGNNIFYFIILIIVLTFFGCSMGTMLCCLFKSEEKANAITPIVSLLFVIFGSVFIPVGHLRGIFKSIAAFTPLKWVTESAFRVIYNQDFSTYFYTLFGLVVLSLACIFVSQIIYRPEDYV